MQVISRLIDRIVPTPLKTYPLRPSRHANASVSTPTGAALAGSSAIGCAARGKLSTWGDAAEYNLDDRRNGEEADSGSPPSGEVASPNELVVLLVQRLGVDGPVCPGLGCLSCSCLLPATGEESYGVAYRS
jgi:hypothetical protein